MASRGHSLKIALTGSHGTGKTTLAKRLADELGLPLITDRARSVAADIGLESASSLLSDKHMATLFQYSILVRQLAEESRYFKFISDRSTLDFLAYWRAYGLSPNWSYNSLCIGNRYDLLIYVPVEFPPEDDGFRDTDFVFQHRVDRELCTLLAAVPWPQLTVSGSVEERAQKVIDWLNKVYGTEVIK